MSYRNQSQERDALVRRLNDIDRELRQLQRASVSAAGGSVALPFKMGIYEFSINGLGQLIATHGITSTVTVVAIP